MSDEESYAKAFPFEKMLPGILDTEMIEDNEKSVNEAIKGKSSTTSLPQEKMNFSITGMPRFRIK